MSLEGKSTYGSGWNSAAMDVVPLILPALIGRPLYIWEYSVHLRRFPDGPQECSIVEVPGVPACDVVKGPVHLLRTKAAIDLAHYDLLLKK